MRVPPALRPGDTIDVVAPSSPFDRTLAWRGLGWLRERYRVRFDRAAFEATGYFAGSDERRLAELDRAIRSPDSRAIVAIRGGYGANRIAHRLDWRAFIARPKWLVGFSDITALHVEASAHGVASIHGAMVAALGRGDARARQAWIEALETPHRTRTMSRLATLAPGYASGPAFGGNLAMIHACAAAGRLRPPAGAILFIEDVGERPYRMDRALATLSVGGYLDQIRGVVCGEFVHCHPGPDGTCAEQVVREAFAGRAIPVVTGFPIGHGLRNEPLHLGSTAEVRADDAAGVVRWGMNEG